MSAFKDLTNLRVGKLVILHKHSQDAYNRYYWLCQCDCGNNKVIASRHLVNNKTLSCGCLKIITAINNGKNNAHKTSGEKSYLYKKSISDFERLNRRNSEITKIKHWRESVFKRDNYTCNLCNVKGSKLQAHHLNSWASFKEQRFEIDNGITLCKKCHFDFHHSLGGFRKECKKNDYINFKAIWYLNHELSKFRG